MDEPQLMQPGEEPVLLPDDSLASPAELAAAVRVTRSTFRALYDQHVQAQGSRARAFMLLNLSVDDDRVAFERALRQANDQGWLSPFILSATEAGFFEDDHASPAARVRLQRVLNAAAGFLSAELFVPATIKATRQVCLVEIDGGASRGSGFLVGPQTIVTAWHVVARLLDPATGQPLPGSHQRIRVRFDYLSGTVAGRRGALESDFGVVPNWLVAGSPCHPLENPSRGTPGAWPTPLSELEGYYDFAALRLDGTPGLERGHQVLCRECGPWDGGHLVVFQHPDALPQRFALTEIVEFRDDIGRWRMAHQANTGNGSSGGLCLDGRFEAVGLHQSAIGENWNAAVPAAHIAATLGGEVLEMDATLTTVDRIASTKRPLLGRREFQVLAWQVAQGAYRILTVMHRSKEGNSFSVHILRSLLPAEHHQVVVLSASDVPSEAGALANRLLELVGSPHLHDLPPPVTTDAAWTRDVLFPRFAEAFEAGAKGRLVWLALDDLSKQPLGETAARRFLETIYAGILAIPHMRIVLLEHIGAVPGADDRLVVSEPRPQTQPVQDVVSYLMRRYGRRGLDDSQARMSAEVVMHIANRDQRPLLQAMSEAVADNIEPALEGFYAGH
ncbi:trypsin-like serine peptidase [Methylorubrum thiocyanatum]|uniref:trypsin-like serine peptidase n=1 Tax=Methylorubrum thiocyanatum TaxID=47958 RepID=UPI00364E8C50